MKRGFFGMVLILLLNNIIGCGGGEGGGDGNDGIDQPSADLSFQEGVPPENVSGSYKIFYQLKNNNCRGLTLSKSNVIVFSQDGDQLTMTTPSGIYEGIVSGNAFKFEHSKTNTSDGCSVSGLETTVGSVVADSISGISAITFNFEGACKDYKDCKASADFSGSRISQTTDSVPKEDSEERTMPDRESLFQGWLWEMDI